MEAVFMRRTACHLYVAGSLSGSSEGSFQQCHTSEETVTSQRHCFEASLLHISWPCPVITHLVPEHRGETNILHQSIGNVRTLHSSYFWEVAFINPFFLFLTSLCSCYKRGECQNQNQKARIPGAWEITTINLGTNNTCFGATVFYVIKYNWDIYSDLSQ